MRVGCAEEVTCMPRKSTMASSALLSELYEREKVSTTSQPGPMLSHASRKSATGTFLT